MFFDVAVSRSNFNKLTKTRIHSARHRLFLSQFSKIENWHDSKNVLPQYPYHFFCLNNLFIYQHYCKKRSPQTSKNIAIISYYIG